MAEPIAPGWVSLHRAAREYLHVDDSMLRCAIKRGELPAYKKPMEPGSRNQCYFVNLQDVDNWIRTFWEPYPTIPSA